MTGKTTRTKATKSNVVKALQGSLDSKRVNPREPKLKLMQPILPPHLDSDEKAAWFRFAALILKLKVLTEIDGPAIESMARSYVQWNRAHEDVRNEGMIVDQPMANGFVKRVRNPALAIINESERRLMFWYSHYGMMPVDRARLIVIGELNSDGDPEDHFAKTKSGKIDNPAPLTEEDRARALREITEAQQEAAALLSFGGFITGADGQEATPAKATTAH